MNQPVSRSTRTRAIAPPQDPQEPAFRTIRRAREDGATATLLEARGHGGPLEPATDPTMPSSLRAKGRWRERVDDAGRAWARLTESDLHGLEGHENTLAALIQARYGITRWEADRQVMAFVEDHVSSAL